MVSTIAKRQMIIVQRTDKQSRALPLDTNDHLNTIRTFLSGRKFMRSSDRFFYTQSTPIEPDDEDVTRLEDILARSDNGLVVLNIGQPPSPLFSIIPSELDQAEWYGQLNDDQKKQLFTHIGLFQGYTITPERGFSKTFKSLFSMKEHAFPTAMLPEMNAEMVSTSSFSKVTHELKKSGAQTASVSFSSPYVSAESEFKQEQSTTTASSKVTEYLLTRYIDRRVQLEFDLSHLEVNPAFARAVQFAVRNVPIFVDGKLQPIPEDILNSSYKALIEVLNEWGYYIPRRVTLGGAIFSTDETQVESFSEAETKKREFSVSVKVGFGQISGGASYRDSTEASRQSTREEKIQNIAWQRIGGEGVVIEKEYGKWVESLKKAINWRVIEIHEFYPSLLLLLLDDKNTTTFEQIVHLLCSRPESLYKAKVELDRKSEAARAKALETPTGRMLAIMFAAQIAEADAAKRRLAAQPIIDPLHPYLDMGPTGYEAKLMQMSQRYFLSDDFLKE